MTVNTCHEDGDCRDPVRSKCMGTLLREAYGKARANGRPHLLPAGRVPRPPHRLLAGRDLHERRAAARLAPARHLRPQLRCQRQLPAQLLLLLQRLQQEAAAHLHPRAAGAALPTPTSTACSASAWRRDAAFKVCSVRVHQRPRLREVRQRARHLVLQRRGLVRGRARLSRHPVRHRGRLPVPGRDLRAHHQPHCPAGSACMPCPARKCRRLRGCAPRLPAAGGRSTHRRPGDRHVALGLLARLPGSDVRGRPPTACRACPAWRRAAGPRGEGLQLVLPERRRLRGQPLLRGRLVRPRAGICRAPLLEGDPCERAQPVRIQACSCLGPHSERRNDADHCWP